MHTPRLVHSVCVLRVRLIYVTALPFICIAQVQVCPVAPGRAGPTSTRRARGLPGVNPPQNGHRPKAHHPDRANGGVEGRVPNPREPLGGSPQGGVPPERDQVRWRELPVSGIFFQGPGKYDECVLCLVDSCHGRLLCAGYRKSFWQSISSR